MTNYQDLTKPTSLKCQMSGLQELQNRLALSLQRLQAVLELYSSQTQEMVNSLTLKLMDACQSLSYSESQKMLEDLTSQCALLLEMLTPRSLTETSERLNESRTPTRQTYAISGSYGHGRESQKMSTSQMRHWNASLKRRPTWARNTHRRCR